MVTSKIMLLVLMLTGCGTTDAPTLSQSVSTSSAETSTEITVETETPNESIDSQKQYLDKELQTISLRINYNPDGTYAKALFYIHKDNDTLYFSSDLTGNTDEKCGINISDENGMNYYYFSDTLAERTDAMYNNLYNTFAVSNSDIIEEAFMTLAQQSADIMNSPEASDSNACQAIDMTDMMPQTLSLVIDDATYEINIITVEMDGESFAKEKNEPDSPVIPGWIDEKGKYRYLNQITIFIKVPIEQLSLFYDFYDQAYEEEKQKQSESTDPYNEVSDNASEVSLFTNPMTALTGTWYDPTKYNTAEFTFNGDGTGSIFWGNSTDSYTYSIDGNTISCALESHTITITIASSDSLSYGGSKYIKKE